MRNIYAIRDRVAQDLAGLQIYMLLVFLTDAQAVRYFGDAITDPQSILARHPADYELILCGSVSTDGHLVSHEVGHPKVIITGDTLVTAMEPKLVKEA